MKRALTAAALAACMLGSVAAAAAPASQPAQLKDLVRQNEFESAKISPTGDYLAVAMPKEGQTMLGILDLGQRKVSGHLRFARGEHVANYWWVGPRRVVVSVANTDGPLDQPRLTGELYAIDADGRNQKYLFGYRGRDHTGSRVQNVVAEYASAQVLDALPDEPDHALIAVWPWNRGRDAREPLIERINVYTGDRTRIGVVPGFAPLDAAVDRSGRLRFAYSSDRSGAFHLYAKADTVTGWREIEHPGGAPADIDLHGATEDGSSVFLTTGDVKGRTCLREYRFDRGALVERQCRDNGAVGVPVFSFDDATLIALRNEAGRPETRILATDHPDARLLQVLGKTFAGQRVGVTSRTLDGRKIVVQVDSDRNPGDFYLIDRATRKAEYLLSRRAWIDPAAMAPMAAITYPTRDGATIHAYLTAAAGEATRRAPLVIMPHGGPHGPRDFWQWHPWAQALASRGYAVLQPNFRGSGGYGYAHQSAGYRKWGTLMQDDLTDAVKWAVSRGIADPARVCIMGGSYGGYAALMSVTREPDLYRCAIGLAGVYDLVSHAEDSDIADRHMGRVYHDKVLGDTATMRAQSPISHLDKLKVPVLIAHGTEDMRVRFNQAKRLRKALEKQGKPYEWLEYEDEEHGFWVDANHEDFLQKALAFLDKHIGAAAPAAASASAQTQ